MSSERANLKLLVFIGSGLKPLTDVASKCPFACDLLTTEYDEQLLEAIITLETSDVTCTCNGASAIFTLGELLAMATRNSHRIMLYELSFESLFNS